MAVNDFRKTLHLSCLPGFRIRLCDFFKITFFFSKRYTCRSLSQKRQLLKNTSVEIEELVFIFLSFQSVEITEKKKHGQLNLTDILKHIKIKLLVNRIKHLEDKSKKKKKKKEREREKRSKYALQTRGRLKGRVF